MNSTHCPSCQQDIGFLSIFTALTPNQIRCPHCRAKLCYRPAGWGMLIVASLAATPFILLSAYYLLTQWDASGFARFALYTLSLFLIWLPFEYGLACRLRKHHSLELRSGD